MPTAVKAISGTDPLHEVATTLSDYLVALVCLAALWSLASTRAVSRQRGGQLFFAGMAGASILGGSWHGFFSAMPGISSRIVWWLTMLLSGVASTGLALTGLELLGVRVGRTVGLSVVGALGIFAVLAWQNAAFWLALSALAVGGMICLAGLAFRLRTGLDRSAICLLLAIVLAVLAGLAQQNGIALDSRRFDHNATFHVLLLPALGLAYVGFRGLAASHR